MSPFVGMCKHQNQWFHSILILFLESDVHLQDGVGYTKNTIRSTAMAAEKCSKTFVTSVVAIHSNKERKEAVITTTVIKEAGNRILLKVLTESNRQMKNNS